MLFQVNLNAMLDLENVLVIDIETVPAFSSFNKLDNKWQALWEKKANRIAKDHSPEEAYGRAGIYAEFGKIICVGLGAYYFQGDQLCLRVTSFAGDNEKDLLDQLSAFLKMHYGLKHHLLAAHNGKEFDYPFLCRRMIANQVELPEILDISGKKPWEVQHLDTMELWKFGDYKSYTSLELLAAVFDIKTSKDDIDGSQVAQVYYQEKNLERIAQYCQKDVVTTAQVLAKMQLNLQILPSDIEFI